MLMTSSKQQYRVGDATITCLIEDVLTSSSPALLYPDWDTSGLDDRAIELALGRVDERRENLILNVNVWIVEFRGKVLIIDTGIGNDKERPFNPFFHRRQTPFLKRLEALGIRCEAVDHVLMTHVHADHVGWNTVKNGNLWVPTFPNAKYVVSQVECDFFSTPASESRRMIFEDSLQPAIEAGQVVTVGEQGGAYIEGVSFIPTTGHSPGHMSISIKSSGQEAIFIGDLLHNPVQVYQPQWNSVFCVDPERSRASRRWMLDYAARAKAILFVPHFPETSAGMVTRGSSGYEWRYV